MKIEVLFPELCNLNGDISNIKYLQKCMSEAEIIETAIEEKPAFVENDDINLIYLGTMTEKGQEIVVSKLKKYKSRLEELIKNNQPFLVTGNAIEIFGKYIENEDKTKIECLGIFDVYAKRDMLHRHNSFFLGEYEDIEILGFKSQFTMMYGNNEEDYFIKVKNGIGINKNSKLEGIKKNNFFATYLIGPFLILNPLFTLKLLKIMGEEEPKIAFNDDIIKAYNVRLEKFKKLNSSEE